jgi:CheY-like chemotaxis protein
MLDGRSGLVADENETTRALLRRQMEEWGMTVTEAATGKEVRQHLRDGAYDVALLDPQMAATSEQTVAEWGRERDALPPVVLLSAVHQSEAPVAAGRTTWLRKPIKRVSLYDVLSDVLRGPASSPPVDGEEEASFEAARTEAASGAQRQDPDEAPSAAEDDEREG